MIGNCDSRSDSFMQGLRDVLGPDFGPDELASVDLLEEDVRILDQIDQIYEPEGSRTLVTRDVYMNSCDVDQSPDRSGFLFSWDHSPDRTPNVAKRMKKSKTEGLGSSCSSPALSDSSDDGPALLEWDDFSVGSSPVSGSLIKDIRKLTDTGDAFLDDLVWMNDTDPLFTTFITPPTPVNGRNTTEKRKRESKQSSCSSSSVWNSPKKWSQLRYDEKREALSGLIKTIDELGVREGVDLNRILNISPFCGNPAIDLNSINDDKWKDIKTYLKKLMPVKVAKDSLSKPSSQLRSWQPSDHIYAPLKRPSPCPPSRTQPSPQSRTQPRPAISVQPCPPTRVQLCPPSRVQPCPSSCVLPLSSSQAQSRLLARSHLGTSLVSSSASASRYSSSNNRRPTLNVLLNPSKSHSVPSKKDFPNDKRNIIKARRKGVNRKYQPSKNSILKKDVIQKITQNANRVTKKGLRMQVDVKDVEKALSGCFDHEERVELSYNDGDDEYIDVQE